MGPAAPVGVAAGCGERVGPEVSGVLALPVVQEALVVPRACSERVGLPGSEVRVRLVVRVGAVVTGGSYGATVALVAGVGRARGSPGLVAPAVTAAGAS